MKPDFKQAFKHGYELDKIVPANIDMEVVKEWTEDQRVIAFKHNDGNFLLACVDDKDGAEYTIYSFMRFFSFGDNTQCSVDFQSSSQLEMIEKLTILLIKDFSD